MKKYIGLIMILIAGAGMSACIGGGGSSGTSGGGGNNVIPDTSVVVNSTMPQNQAESVDVTTSTIKLSFSKEVDTDTVNGENIELSETGANATLGNLLQPGKCATYNGIDFDCQLYLGLSYGQSYQLKVTTKVKDMKGNALSQEYIASFATESINQGQYNYQPIGFVVCNDQDPFQCYITGVGADNQKLGRIPGHTEGKLAKDAVVLSMGSKNIVACSNLDSGQFACYLSRKGKAWQRIIGTTPGSLADGGVTISKNIDGFFTEYLMACDANRPFGCYVAKIDPDTTAQVSWENSSPITAPKNVALAPGGLMNTGYMLRSNQIFACDSEAPFGCYYKSGEDTSAFQPVLDPNLYINGHLAKGGIIRGLFLCNDLAIESSQCYGFQYNEAKRAYQFILRSPNFVGGLPLFPIADGGMSISPFGTSYGCNSISGQFKCSFLDDYAQSGVFESSSMNGHLAAGGLVAFDFNPTQGFFACNDAKPFVCNFAYQKFLDYTHIFVPIQGPSDAGSMATGALGLVSAGSSEGIIALCDNSWPFKCYQLDYSNNNLEVPTLSFKPIKGYVQGKVIQGGLSTQYNASKSRY